MTRWAAIRSRAGELEPELIALRRRIHAHPEIGLDLPETRQAVLDGLSDLPVQVTTHETTSGVVAVLDGRPGPRSLLLRADMDALPIEERTDLPFSSTRPMAMHACGHDAHTAILVGAARIIAELRDEFTGRVVLMFQPGEEGHGGAEKMLAEGLPSTHAAFALHLAPNLPTGRIASRPGVVFGSVDFLEIVVRGKGGHAAMPHECGDPVSAACSIVSEIPAAIARSVPVSAPALVTVTRVHAGEANNVIPDSALLAGTIRSVSERSRNSAIGAIERLAEGVAISHEIEVDVTVTPGFGATVNCEDFTSLVRECAVGLLGTDAYLDLASPVMASEDFSCVLAERPGALALLGAGGRSGGRRAFPCHSSRFSPDEDAIAIGAALHSAIALTYLNAGPTTSGHEKRYRG